MAKILISSIGTGDRIKGYRKAKYEYEKKICETTFISKALTEFLDIDKMFIVGTNGSIWDNVYSEFGGDEDIELEIYSKISEKKLSPKDLLVVNKEIDKYLKNTGSRAFLIDYGINENELWNNFDIYLKILEELHDDDEIYIDITHSFRSLSLFSFVMLQFGQTIYKKKFKIGGVFYGMLEYSFENKGITPIVDLKILFDLLEWMKAIENFTKYMAYLWHIFFDTFVYEHHPLQ